MLDTKPDQKPEQKLDQRADCLFCQIVAEKVPARLFHEDGQCIVFADIKPQAPMHLLVVPKRHLVSLSQASGDNEPLLGHLMMVAAQLAREKQVFNGYRVVVNTGEDGGQTVQHLHLHLLGGRQMHWPPG
jgi:histidine triad (HIT) family protein